MHKKWSMVTPLVVKTTNAKVSHWAYLVNIFNQENALTKWTTQVMVSYTITSVHTATVQVSASHILFKNVEIDAIRSQKTSKALQKCSAKEPKYCFCC